MRWDESGIVLVGAFKSPQTKCKAVWRPHCKVDMGSLTSQKYQPHFCTKKIERTDCCSIVVSILTCHAGDLGSILGNNANFCNFAQYWSSCIGSFGFHPIPQRAQTTLILLGSIPSSRELKATLVLLSSILTPISLVFVTNGLENKPNRVN